MIKPQRAKRSYAGTACSVIGLLLLSASIMKTLDDIAYRKAAKIEPGMSSSNPAGPSSVPDDLYPLLGACGGALLLIVGICPMMNKRISD